MTEHIAAEDFLTILVVREPPASFVGTQIPHPLRIIIAAPGISELSAVQITYSIKTCKGLSLCRVGTAYL